MRPSLPEGGWAAPDGRSDPVPARLAGALLEAAGADQVRAVLLFGSRLARTGPSEASAYDLVVVVADYGAFHRRMKDAGLLGRPPWLVGALARVLPPNVTALDPGVGAVAKCMILDEGHFARALSARAPDHFLKGRLVQKVALVHAADPATEAWVAGSLGDARDDVLRWAGPFFEEPFTAAEAARTMLRVSYRGEVRPESGDRAEAVFEAQRPFLEAVLGRVLDDAEARGEVTREGAAFRFVRAPTAADRRRVRRYFLRSKARATARWLKHVVTFDNWIDYIVSKVERRTGMTVEVTPWERRLPYLLLWPKVIRVLRSRPARMPGDGEAGA